MLAVELIDSNIPRLQLQDTVNKALQLISDFKLTHLSVVSDNKYLGIISEEDLLDIQEIKMPIELMQETFIYAAVYENEHFLNAVKCSIQYNSTIVPVINEAKEFKGAIVASELLKTLGNFAGANEIGGIIVLQMIPSRFAISEISRIVENNDATILHLNTTIHPQTGMLTVTIHTNKKEIATIVSTFERYDFDVIYCLGNEKSPNEIHNNYYHLMNYLNI